MLLCALEVSCTLVLIILHLMRLDCIVPSGVRALVPSCTRPLKDRLLRFWAIWQYPD